MVENKKIIEFYYKDIYKIKKSYHLFEHRNNSKFSRAEFLDDNMIKAIIKQSVINGLNSFRNQDVVITVKTYNDKYFSILCKLSTSNEVVLISVYHTSNSFWRTFIKVQNRINIMNYVVPKMSEQEKNKKKFQKILLTKDLEKEDAYFKNIMNYKKE